MEEMSRFDFNGRRLDVRENVAFQGKGGSVIRALTEETGTSIDIQDDGTINIASRLESLSRPNGVTISFDALPLNKKNEMQPFLSAIETHPGLYTTILAPSGEGMSVSWKPWRLLMSSLSTRMI